jgi:hypothetical protein
MSPRGSFGAGPLGGPVDRRSTRAHEVLALLALAPRDESTAWTAYDLRQWMEITGRVDPEEVRGALALAGLWGAGPTDVVAAAAHIVLVRLAPTMRGEHAARARRNIDSVCSHLRDHVGPSVAAHLPRPEPEPRELPAATVWAYFFASLAFLLLVVVLTG